MSKIIIIDGGIISHKSIFAWGAMKKLQVEGKLKSSFLPNSDYTYFNSIISILKKIVVEKGDIVIVAVDARNSWRKAFYPIYKGQRQEGREKHTLIDWEYHYGLINDINQKLHESTDWHFIKIEDFMTFDELADTPEGIKYKIKNNNAKKNKSFGIEADDIQAVACEYFKDKEVVLVTGDADLDQLDYYSNTKIFSTNTKFKNQKGCYKIIKDPIGVLAKKTKLGDVSDNIIVDKKNDTEHEYELRKFIIDLLSLPEFVKKPITSVFNSLKEKNIDYSKLPFPNSLGKREKYNKIYLLDKKISWEDALKSHEKTEEKRKKKSKEAYEKQKLKKKIQKENAFR